MADVEADAKKAAEAVLADDANKASAKSNPAAKKVKTVAASKKPAATTKKAEPEPRGQGDQRRCASRQRRRL